ncbi:MAG: FAD-dependent oxidoreductase [Planctomycetota bacterium]
MRERYDIVIVGGGIHGVGVAQAAAAHGHSVLLLEQSERLAAGTSSRSSKLIHGGLRYLEYARFSLVAESLRERALLLELAPELVRLRWFYVPVYRHTRRRPWQIRVGLSLYAMLGRLRKENRFEAVPADEWNGLDGLATEGLAAVFRYRDAQADDAQLTRAVMRSAQDLGAELAMPATFAGARLEEDGCRLELLHDGHQVTCHARVVVNAAGPWAPAVLDRIDPKPAARPVELVQGAHILVRGPIERGIYHVEAPSDGRAVLVIPWQGNTLVGTTETPFHGDPDDVRPLAEEQRYLSGVLTHYFPSYGENGQVPILDSFAGLRVLPAGPGRFADRPRDVFLDLDRSERPRVLSIWGGKLTTYRSTAEKVMRRIATSLPKSRVVADTRTLKLTAER